jgi:hypothetical protein
MLKDLNLLAERRNSPVSFVTTERGHKFLHDYASLRQQLRADDLQKREGALQVLHVNTAACGFVGLGIYIIVA